MFGRDVSENADIHFHAYDRVLQSVGTMLLINHLQCCRCQIPCGKITPILHGGGLKEELIALREAFDVYVIKYENSKKLSFFFPS